MCVYEVGHATHLSSIYLPNAMLMRSLILLTLGQKLYSFDKVAGQKYILCLYFDRVGPKPQHKNEFAPSHRNGYKFVPAPRITIKCLQFSVKS